MGDPVWERRWKALKSFAQNNALGDDPLGKAISAGMLGVMESLERQIQHGDREPPVADPAPAGGSDLAPICWHRCLEDRGEGLRCSRPAGHEGRHAFGSITWAADPAQAEPVEGMARGWFKTVNSRIDL